MKYTQMLTHEIGMGCNLAKEHAQHCPVVFRDRYSNLDTSKVMSNETIIRNVEYAYASGFTGMLTWHYYCEPTLYMDRIEEISRGLPEEAKQILWTNGTLLGKNIQSSRLRIFSKIIVSNYERRDWSWLRSYVPEIKVLRGSLDGRLSPGRETRKKCMRPYHELILDYYGNFHLCCGDFRGTAIHLNVHRDGFPAIVSAYQELRERVSREPLPEEAPEICKRCQVRGRDHIDELVPGPFTSAIACTGGNQRAS